MPAPDAGQDRAAPQPEARRTVGRASLTRTRSFDMSAAGRAAKHAWGLYGRTLHGALKLIRGAEAESRHLYVVEEKGEAGETPFIVLLGLVLFFLPVFLVMLGLALAAYYLA
jgi:hypothetical protein